MKKLKLVTFGMCLAMIMNSCSTNTGNGALIGTAGGAVLGGIIGKIAGNTGVGAAVGAAGAGQGSGGGVCRAGLLPHGEAPAGKEKAAMAVEGSAVQRRDSGAVLAADSPDGNGRTGGGIRRSGSGHDGCHAGAWKCGFLSAGQSAEQTLPKIKYVGEGH